MQPRQAAALLGREIDAGFAAAYDDLAASRSLVVDRIVARVGGLPPTSGDVQGTSPDWAVVPWLAEVTLRPTAPAPGRGESGPAGPGTGAGDDVRRRICALPTSTVRGVGPGWAATFARWGLRTVGELAEADPSYIVHRAGTQVSVALPLLSRARDLAEPWPPVPAGATGRTVGEVAHGSPAAEDLAQHTLRAHCLRVLGALDAPVAARLTL